MTSLPAPALLARGPWEPRQIEARWLDDEYLPPHDKSAAADEAITALRERGSPSHDGVAARLVSYRQKNGRLVMELQPGRWALRLVDGDASESVAALCVTRDAGGRWLAGRRAPWLSSWPGRWALGAGGAGDVGEAPAPPLERGRDVGGPPPPTAEGELREEWSVAPQRLRCDALVRLPPRLVMFVGTA